MKLDLMMATDQKDLWVAIGLVFTQDPKDTITEDLTIRDFIIFYFLNKLSKL